MPNKVPAEHREAILAELGTMSDQALADKWAAQTGEQIAKHTIFWMRTQAKIASYNTQPYTKPTFRGKVEDEYPEIINLFGKVPLKHIADRFGVSRSCIKSAANRLGAQTRIDSSSMIESLLAG